MIDTRQTRIWTPYGYLFAEDLYIGEKVISFNPARGVCEYDTVSQIEIEERRCMGLGLNSKSMRVLLTPDHDLLVWNNKLKVLSRVSIESRFMLGYSSKQKSILAHAVFEPYKRSQAEADIEWSARMAATISRHKRAMLDVGNIIDDLGGYEAQLWIDTFIHWNKLLRGRNWMGTAHLANRQVRDVIYNIAPRAGVGARWYIKGNYPLVSIPINGYIYQPLWFKEPLNGLMFNLTTRNGNVLMKSAHGTCLVACNKGE